MTTDHPDPDSTKEKEQTLGRTLVRDLRQGRFRSTLGKDLREIYTFYLDKDRRAKLASMGRIRRWLFLSWWIAKSMFLKLTPTRRILLTVALVLMFQGPTYVSGERIAFSFNVSLISVVILFLILALELKDKLLALDELAIGRAVQRALLPIRNPQVPGWSVWMFTRPANEVGGDLVDYLPIGGGCMGLALGDVAGKGLGAALLMAKLQATLRALAPGCPGLEELGERINAIMHRDGLPSRFATLIFIEIDPNSGRACILNAGHPPPLVLRARGIEELPPTSLPLGIQPDARYVEQSVELFAGELLLVYSDGVTDAQNREAECFGEERLKDFLARHLALPAGQLGQRIVEEVDRFIGEAKPSDDLSLVVLKREI